MTVHRLQDSLGRSIGDLRISITDRCNFRCGYCLPDETVNWLPSDSILTFPEIIRLITIFSGLGVDKLRITGGEPLLRPHLLRLIEQIVEIDGIRDLALTTNGRLLSRAAGHLRAAGIHRLNISLDTLQADRFRQITQRDALGDVLDGIDAARRAGFVDIRVNAVIIRGVNDDEILDFAEFARSTGTSVRFIEFMPLDSGHRWTREQVVPGREMLEILRSRYDMIRLDDVHRASTSRRYRFEDTQGEIGLISPVTDPFCGNCNRLRVTADGQLRSCLFSTSEVDLRGPLRSGADDDEMIDIIASAVWKKSPGHTIGETGFVQPERTMSAIGG